MCSVFTNVHKNKNASLLSNHHHSNAICIIKEYFYYSNISDIVFWHVLNLLRYDRFDFIFFLKKGCSFPFHINACAMRSYTFRVKFRLNSSHMRIDVASALLLFKMLLWINIKSDIWRYLAGILNASVSIQGKWCNLIKLLLIFNFVWFDGINEHILPTTNRSSHMISRSFPYGTTKWKEE